MRRGLLVFGVLLVVLLLFGTTCVGRYNQLIALNERIDGSWAQVENVLQRRNDLIPNLVETVKGYAAHERGVFDEIAEARTRYAGAQTVGEKLEANRQLESALARLLVIVENYPDLKANQNFIRLQDELAGAENRIAVERRQYNESVRAYNTYVQQFPTNLIAGLFGYQRKDVYFEAAEGAKQAPKVKF